MQSFRFAQHNLSSDDPLFTAALADAYANKRRPSCLCITQGVPMYIAHVGDRHLIKRMPNTSSQHRPDCESYEPPAELSGLGEVAGSAIQEDIDSGITALKLDFSLSKTTRRSLPLASGVEADSVRTDGKMLTLRGTLHYLWDEAGLNRWTPAMAGKRSWSVVRKYLLQAAENKAAKGLSLGSSLFIPETFNAEHKRAILERQLAKLLPARVRAGSTRKLMLLIGEVKKVDTARYGQKLVVKHLPDLPFMVADDLSNRMAKRFETELALWNADASTHLVAIATFGFDNAGVAAVEEMALVLTTENWIPVEQLHDMQLLAALIDSGRRFSKGLRYNLASSRPLASVVLSDTAPLPFALYAIPPNVNDEYRLALEVLTSNSELPQWIWMAGEASMPPLPVPAELCLSQSK